MSLTSDCVREIYATHRRRFPDLHKSADSVRSQYRADEVEFAKAIDTYKRRNRRPYPTAREVLAVAIALGYRKTAPPAAAEPQEAGRGR